MTPEQAQSILNSPYFKELLDMMETSIIDGMKKSALKDLDTHHELVLSLQLLENMKRVLVKVAQEGKVAAFNTKMAKSVL